MRKLILSAALATSALALSACSSDVEDVEDEEIVENETVDDAADSMADAEAAGVLDANIATEEELAAMEGISPEIAEAIAAGRPYSSVTELHLVLTGVGSEEEAAAMLERVFVPVNLNNTTREELALIPGIDDRMIHEFEEYVPYDDMAEFDREMAKYIDADEIARYRQYVTL